MRIEAVVFDMDGLMLDTEPLYKMAWQRASADLGYELDNESYAKLVGRPTAACEEALRAQFGPEFPLDRFRARWPELWQAGVAEAGIVAKPGLFELLAFLDQRGLPLALATSSEAEYTDFSLQSAGLAGRFAVVVTGDQVAQGKPAPDIYLEAAARLRTKPDLCLALEDSEAGILAASGAGMIAVLIPDWTHPSEIAVRAAFRVLASLNEVRALVEPFIANEAG